ncbi:hypothetical protein ACXIZN_42280 [Amycolatopsis sp. TRM77291]
MPRTRRVVLEIEHRTQPVAPSRRTSAMNTSACASGEGLATSASPVLRPPFGRPPPSVSLTNTKVTP